MCTALTYSANNHYFGRNLDLSYTYRETVTVTPRNYPFLFRRMDTISAHYALIGMAMVEEDYPLYYEATNEAGLSMAGLNFPGIAVYQEEKRGMDNVTPFEFIPWILSQCATVAEALKYLNQCNLVAIPFSSGLPLSPLHWIISDQAESITVEPIASGLMIYKNPVGVLTNNPPFDYQMYNLANYMNLTREAPVNRFSDKITLKPYCLGIGGMGLPGDLSSVSRFVKAAFTKLNSVSGETDEENVTQFFHILDSVEQQRGCVEVKDGEYEITVYSSCCNTDKGIYYYTTYGNRQITGVNMHHTNLEADRLTFFPLVTGQQIRMEN